MLVRPAGASAVCIVVLLTLPAALAAQQPAPEPGWTLRTRVVMSGSSDHSEPAGFEVYSGIGVEAALSRRLTRRLSTELTLRFEPREVDRQTSPGQAESLGSVELTAIANTERHLPDAFIGADGRSLTPAFADYALPLLGGPLPEFARFAPLAWPGPAPQPPNPGGLSRR